MTGVMPQLLDGYLQLRHGLGYRSVTQERALRSFARYLEEQGVRPPVALEATLGWAGATSSRDPHNPARRLNTVRGFLRYLAARDDGATPVPPAGLLGPVAPRRAPHVYSDEEIADLLSAAGRLSPTGGLRPRCYVTLFGLLACTGMRIAEGLALACGDVDLDAQVITVRSGKRGRARLVPLHESAIDPLREYLAERIARHGQPDADEPFWRTDRSEPLSYSTVHSTFCRLRARLGWSRHGRTRLPRIHDLRHHMVIARIQAWYAEGVDVDAMLPVLATYLGHTEVRDTYWYLTAVPELTGLVADRFEAFAAARHQPGGAP